MVRQQGPEPAKVEQGAVQLFAAGGSKNLRPAAEECSKDALGSH